MNRRSRARISPKVIRGAPARAIACAACVAALSYAVPARAGGSLADVDAAARAAGNQRPVALAIGRALFARMWPVQILKVRVDGVPGHEIAGLVLSGVKFHGRPTVADFVAEVAELVRETFAASDVEEVDLWVTVPLRVGEHAVVAGDKALPTTRIVYGATVPREAGPSFAQRLTAGDAVYWDARWKAGLQAP